MPIFASVDLGFSAELRHLVHHHMDWTQRQLGFYRYHGTVEDLVPTG